MDYDRPNPDFELEQEWWWPSYKFALPLDDLFGTLYTQYNTVAIPVQDPEAFHHDVYETCTVATTALEFHTLLAERRKLRLQELRESWGTVATHIAARPKLFSSHPASELEAADMWGDFVYFSREFSFDALVRFFSHFAGFTEHALEPASLEPARSTSQKRGRSPDDAELRSRKRKIFSEDSSQSELQTSVEVSYEKATELKICMPPGSLPSPVLEVLPTSAPADSAPTPLAPELTHAELVKPKRQRSRIDKQRSQDKILRRSTRIRERSARSLNTGGPNPGSKATREVRRLNEQTLSDKER
ncbi:unnamed protein product [Discula destructiva]